ncbi:MAG: hypothetical protein J6P12_02760, partial [Methanobrevibacter sp.]|nr:hypothetical protein [Methanobrevibacter sp.]
NKQVAQKNKSRNPRLLQSRGSSINNMFNIICNIILNVVKLSLAETVIIDMITKNILGLFKFFIIHI